MKKQEQLPENIDALIRQHLSSFELSKQTQTNNQTILKKIEAQRVLIAARNKRRGAINVAAGAISGVAAIVAIFAILGYYYPSFLPSLRSEAIDFSVFKQSLDMIKHSPSTLYIIPFAILLTIDWLIRRPKKASSKQ